MCQAFSCIITEDCHARWKFGMDRHEEIIQKFRLKDDGQNFARCEISPANGSYLAPDEWVFKIDEQAKPKWWTTAHEAEARGAWKEWKIRLDKILVYKPIVHPFRDIKPPKEITKRHVALLKKWAGAWVSVGASVWAGAWVSVWDSVRASVRASVGAGVWASVGDSVWDSVGDSVWDSVGAGVRASVWAYGGSFFNLPRSSWKHTEEIKLPGDQRYPFQSVVDLWEVGLVPSFDGKKLRLHGGPNGGVLWEGKP